MTKATIQLVANTERFAMQMKMLILVVFVGTFFGSTQKLSAQNEVAYQFSLPQAIGYGMENSIQGKNALLDAAMIRNRAYEVITAGLPKVNTTIDYTRNFKLPTSIIPGGFFGTPGEDLAIQFGSKHNADIRFELTQLILDGRYIVGLKARDAVIRVANQQAMLDAERMKEEVTKSYYASLATTEIERRLRKNLKSMERTIYETEALLENGFAEQLDVDRLQLAFSQLKTSIDEAQLNKQNALDGLKFLIGLDLKDSLELTDSIGLYLAALDQPHEEGKMELRKDFQLLSIRNELRRLDIIQQRAGYYPSLNAFFSYGLNAQRQDFDIFSSGPWFKSGYYGLSMSIPIFDGLERQAKLEKTKLDMQILSNQLSNFDQVFELESNQAENAFETARNKYQDQKSNLALANKILTTVKTAYKEGRSSSFELSEAERGLIETEVFYMQAVYELLLAQVQLKKAHGQL